MSQQKSLGRIYIFLLALLLVLSAGCGAFPARFATPTPTSTLKPTLTPTITPTPTPSFEDILAAMALVQFP